MKYIHPKKIINKIKNLPNYLWYWGVPDKIVLQREFAKEHNRRLNLKDPRTIDEKIQWIKLYDRKPIYHTMIDKIAAKTFVSERIGSDYVIPLLGSWTSFEEINFDELPESFVLKCNHDSGSYVIVPDKNTLDKQAAKYRLNNALSRDYYHFEHKQWGYKDIPPMILAETYIMEDRLEYQVFCNNENPVFFLVRSDLGAGESGGFCVCYSLDWEKVDYRVDKYPEIDIPKPVNFQKMIEFAKILSKGTLHLRVDFYETSRGDLFVGELTFYSHGGNFCNFTDEACQLLNKTLLLPNT